MVATPRKWPGRCSPSSPRESCSTSTQVWKPGGYISSCAGAKSTSAPAAAAMSASRSSSRGYAARSAASSNWAGLTKTLTTTVSHSARAAAISASCPAWSAPIVGTRPTTPSSSSSDDPTDDLHKSAFVVSASVTYIGSSSGRSARIAARCASTVAQSPRAIGPGQLEAVLDRAAHQRVERLRRRACCLEQ